MHHIRVTAPSETTGETTGETTAAAALFHGRELDSEQDLVFIVTAELSGKINAQLEAGKQPQVEIDDWQIVEKHGHPATMGDAENWQIARVFGMAASAMVEGGRTSDALVLFDEAIERLGVSPDLSDPRTLIESAEIYAAKAAAQFNDRHPAESIASFAQAMSSLERVLALDPGDVLAATRLIPVRLSLADVTLQAGNHVEARSLYDRTIAEAETILERFPDHAGYRKFGLRWRGEALTARARLKTDLEDQSSAIEDYNAAAESFDEAAEWDPADRNMLMEMAASLRTSGYLSAKVEKYREAEKSLDEALRTYDRLLDSSRDAEALNARAFAGVTLADLHAHRGSQQESSASLDAAAADIEEALKLLPDNEGSKLMAQQISNRRRRR